MAPFVGKESIEIPLLMTQSSFMLRLERWPAPYLRFSEWLLLIFVAIVPAVFSAANPQVGQYYLRMPSLFYGYMLINEMSMIALLMYVLFRQGRDLSDLGLSFKKGQLKDDIKDGIGLAVVCSALMAFLYYATWYGYFAKTGRTINLEPENIEFTRTPLTVLYMAAMIINPFFEELIVRAFTMTEVLALSGRPWLAVAASVLLQFSYHLYQGVPAMFLLCLFLVFSIYFFKTRRIFPLILAHMIFDLGSMLRYATR